MKLRFLWIAVIMGVAFAVFVERAFSDTLRWDTPYGLINLNLDSSEVLAGYDGILKQAIAGYSLPVYTTPKNIVTIHIGAGAPWPVGNQSTVQPLVLAGHDLFREIPAMAAYPNFQLNVFGRWATNQGKAGAGLAFSWSFATPSPQTLPPPPPPVVNTPQPVATPPPTPEKGLPAEPVAAPAEPVLSPTTGGTQP